MFFLSCDFFSLFAFFFIYSFSISFPFPFPQMDYAALDVLTLPGILDQLLVSARARRLPATQLAVAVKNM
jgi:hypothetical protein